MKKAVFVSLFLIFIFPVFSGQKNNAGKLLEEGKKAYIAGRYSEAIKKLNLAVNFIKNKQQLVDAYITLALTYFTVGDENGARENLKKALSANPRLVLDPDYYPPKFISLAEEVRKELLVEIKLKSNVVAKFRVDGEEVGTGTLIPVSLPKGLHSFRVEAEGYRPIERKIEISSGGQILYFELSPVKPALPKPPEGVKLQAGKKGGSKLLYYLGGAALGAGVVAVVVSSKKSTPKEAVLNITTEPPGAEIEVDGVRKGTAPLTVNVSEGSHKIRAYMELYGEATREIQVKGGRNYNVSVTLSPYKYKFDRCFSGYNYTFSAVVDSDGNVYFTATGMQAVIKMDSRGSVLRKAPMGRLPLGIAYFHTANEESIFVSTFYGWLFKYGLDLEPVWSKFANFEESGGMVADEKGSVYICDNLGDLIYKYSVKGNFQKTWKVSSPLFITYLKNTLYVTTTDGYIKKFSTSGESKGRVSPSKEISSPGGISTDGRHLYVVDTGKKKVVKMFPDGVVFVSFDISNLQEIMDIAANPRKGDVWIATGNMGKICHWNMTNETISSGKMEVKTIGTYQRVGLDTARPFPRRGKPFFPNRVHNMDKRRRK